MIFPTSVEKLDFIPLQSYDGKMLFINGFHNLHQKNVIHQVHIKCIYSLLEVAKEQNEEWKRKHTLYFNFF